MDIQPDKHGHGGIDATTGADLIRQDAQTSRMAGLTPLGATVQDDADVAALKEMEAIRQRHGRILGTLYYFAMDDWAKLRVLHGLVEHPLGVTYQTLLDYVGVSLRTLKKYVYELVDAGVVTKAGRPVVVSWADTDFRYLAADVTASV